VYVRQNSTLSSESGIEFVNTELKPVAVDPTTIDTNSLSLLYRLIIPVLSGSSSFLHEHKVIVIAKQRIASFVILFFIAA
jgi:hypothetical protein